MTSPDDIGPPAFPTTVAYLGMCFRAVFSDALMFYPLSQAFAHLKKLRIHVRRMIRILRITPGILVVPGT